MTTPLPPDSVVTRFAPSPSGNLHLGHAYAALVAHDEARQAGGRFLLRLEDIDQSRCRPEFEQAIFDDLKWLGLDWEKPVRRQSDHLADYGAALDALNKRGVIYPCFCTRAEIRAEIARSPAAPHGPAGANPANPEGALYPGVCRQLSEDERRQRLDRGDGHALRLDVAQALEILDDALLWCDAEAGEVIADPASLGDVVLARKDTPTSYHLSVVVDDAAQGVTLVTRGSDLFQATHIHRLLQALLDLPTPAYHHHKLIVDDTGKRLATRHDALSLAKLKDDGATPEEIRIRLGYG